MSGAAYTHEETAVLYVEVVRDQGYTGSMYEWLHGATRCQKPEKSGEDCIRCRSVSEEIDRMGGDLS